MNKKQFVSTVLTVAIVFLISGCDKKPVSQGNEANSQNQEQNQAQGNNPNSGVENPSGEYSINDLLTMNKPMKCTWKENSSGNSDVTNVLYINGKNFYQDVSMGDIGHSFTLNNGDYLYIWSDFNDTASKIKYSEIKISPPPGQDKAQDTTGLEQKRDFVCEKWTADNSIFSPPTDKNFKDITNEMNRGMENLNNGVVENAKQQMCDLCQNAPDQETKDECLKNAQCDQ